ncbi:MAG: preprotein translocase subunit YajC [Pseudomonadota bacterium]|nr:preprotein translocase subunit YajC [Pseudomonadales bacterium]MDY6920562.1 preprotein translocase subunit YajC [Pseudomonadota bacterium]
MSFFIADAMAEPGAAAAQQGNPMTFWGMLIIMVAIFYFMIIRPQSKRNKMHKELMEGLSKGDEVVLSGGMMGKVTKVTEEYVVVEVANNTEISFQKAAVTATLPKGTLKGI